MDLRVLLVLMVEQTALCAATAWKSTREKAAMQTRHMLPPCPESGDAGLHTSVCLSCCPLLGSPR